MPRTSAEAHAAVAFEHAGPRLQPPDGLTEEQAGYWRALVEAFPADRFGEDHVPVLLDLVRSMAISAHLAEQINAVRKRPLSKGFMSHYLQLTQAWRAQAKTTATLSTKLRLTPDTTRAAQQETNERKKTPPGPRPWEGIGMRVVSEAAEPEKAN